MKTIELKVYSFDELTEDAKKNAIDNIRESYYEYNDFCQWAVDDCALLEPKHDELAKLFGKKYNFPLIENTRKIYFSFDRDRYIDISDAMVIKNDYQFLKWLGLNDRLIEKTEYCIGKDTIEFDTVSYDIEFTEIEGKKLELATEKFENHCEDILNRLEADYEYRFTDEAIIEDINCNDFEFLEDGSRY